MAEIRPSEFGFARGAVAGRVGPFAATLRYDLASIAATLGALRSESLQPTAEVALRQTLADLLAGLHAQTATGFLVRVSLRDRNSCEACLELHGTVVRAGTEHYTAFKPPNHCKGGDRCRCEYVDVLRGRIGMQFSAYVTESSPSRVAGELAVTGGGDPTIADPGIRAAEAARFGPGPKLLRERERQRLQHVLSETLRFQSLSRRAEEAEARRLIRQALTDGKPVLAGHMLHALSHLARTGAVPPLSQRGGRAVVALPRSVA